MQVVLFVLIYLIVLVTFGLRVACLVWDLFYCLCWLLLFWVFFLWCGLVGCFAWFVGLILCNCCDFNWFGLITCVCCLLW